MATEWIELVTGSLEQKKRYRQYKARTRQLPANYRTAVEALERYMMYFGPVTSGDTRVVDARGPRRSVRAERGGRNPDPRDRRGGPGGVRRGVSSRTTPEGQWISRERERLTNAIDRAAGEDTGNEEGSA